MVDQLELLLAEKGPDVTHDEKHLLNVAFKNWISPKLEACKTIAANGMNPKYDIYADALLTYKTGIEEKL